MKTAQLIPLDVFCTSHDIDVSFISSLHENGIIDIITIEETGYLNSGELQQLERYINFFYELNINLEGIDAIKHLLTRINAMHDEITALRNRLRLYEDDQER